MSSVPRLQGKVALVTGSTQGIGKAIARLFVAEGAKLILNGLAGEAALAAELVAELGEANAMFVAADIADEAAVQAMAAQGAARFGPIGVLVNNAGMDVFAEPLEMTAAQWQRCFAVDLEGALHCSRAVLPGMLAGGGGSIVNIASVHGHRIIPGAFPYPVAKHALIGMTKALGIQYAARGVRVNSISPGLILSERVVEWLASIPAEEARRQVELLPCKRVGTPEEVAYTALFLASDEARFINATDILIDGGRSQLYHE
ncbi:SDR family oxidoreductase [Roseateles saccharophilus]|uniref:NAD(P)-dependent dehydrogenase (Short-subunit alcohol dehydrogenase family) n=1 Tax=Roseateles saccharophilus TaxID=304 RepID=A0A4R3ULV9_ROSSA|nr:SDR family oxidoreductase [Roseateles saccharophilus]MDG0836032.1 SDR family oxidoreductase [Roseateles saccharophilus]TCU91842.1 NAD(P)-dependent dehydrogenase (short-subunit alcohol dehydrogenase family) [Roseateles saccharophilus]